MGSTITEVAGGGETKMADAYFEYWIKAYNWPGGSLQITVSEPPIDRVVIEKFSVHEEWRETSLPLRLEVFLSDIGSYQEARRASDEYSAKVQAVIAFVGEFFVTNVHFNQGLFNGQRIEGRGRIGSFSNGVMSVNRPDITHIVSDLEFHLKKCHGLARNYYTMFCAAMQADGIGRYLLLYLILLTHFDDKQPKVDNFIRREEPGVIETPRPDKPHVMETVYSRLRNEVGHARPGASQDRTTAEIKHYTSALILLVKKVINLM